MKGLSDTKNLSSLRKMRRIALGALLFCVVGMMTCWFLERGIPWLAWPRAFFEAGTVGALADWFAVVALFRHPLGIPIPHTAILPNNKDRVAVSLADFIENSFLTEEQLGPRFRGINYAKFASEWLVRNADLLAQKAAEYTPRIIEGISDDEMVALLSERARSLIRTTEIGPLLGNGLELLAQNGRDREIYESILKSSSELVASHRPMIQEKIQQEIPIPVEIIQKFPGLNLLAPALEELKSKLASAVAARTIEKVQGVLSDAKHEQDHSLWKAFDEKLHGFIRDLQSSPELAEKIHAMQETLASSALPQDFAVRVWKEIREFLLRDCAAEDSQVRLRIHNAIQSIARQLQENALTSEGINTFLGEQVLTSILAARPYARELIISTIQNWDSKEMSERLEGTVGKDLQFIRLNGTLIGGLIGLIIHGVFLLLQHI